jgi:hypothetical protein
MSLVSELWHKVFRTSTEVEAARKRIELDDARISIQAERIEKGTSALENRVDRVNHISAAVEAMLKGHR